MIIQDCCFSLSNKKKACWILTNQCNLNCSYCAVNTLYIKNNTYINKQLLKANLIANICRENSIDKIILSGGEPTLIPDIVKIVEFLSSTGINVSLSTNGTLLLPLMLSQLKDAGLVKVIIGLHQEAEIIGKKGTLQLYKLREVAGYIKNANIQHEYSIVLTPSVLFKTQELYNLINISSPSLINLIEPQYCGRMKGINYHEYKNFKNNGFTIAKMITKVFTPFKTVYVKPLCNMDCPSGKQIFGISNLHLDQCPWKNYLDNSINPEFYNNNKYLSIRSNTTID